QFGPACPIALGDTHVVKVDGGVYVRNPHPHLLFRLPERQARRAIRYIDQGETFLPLRGVGCADHAVEIGDTCAAWPHLLAIDYPLVSLEPGGRPNRAAALGRILDVAASRRFRDGETGAPW